MQNTGFSTNKTLNLNGRLINLETPKVMGILNVTPDSFYDGGKFDSEVTILKQVEKMISEGADFIDVGGYSSRPGAHDIDVEEETKRVINTIRLISKRFSDSFISVDTFRAAVASAAVQEGAVLINDISGGTLDTEMLKTVASLQVPYILMHMRGTPQTMTKFVKYDNLVRDIIDHFHTNLAVLKDLGIKDVIIDPGFGFAKTRAQNFELLSRLDDFKIVGKPIMAGLSRKSMVWKTLDITPEDALNGTTVLNTIALLKGVDILRVHDVKACVEVVRLTTELKRSVT